VKVLLATDGSEFSEKAVQKCCALFDESVNTEIRIVSIAEPAAYAIDPYGLSVSIYQGVEAASQTQAAQAVSRAEDEIRKGFPDLAVELSTTVIKGSAARAIVEEAERWGGRSDHCRFPWLRFLAANAHWLRLRLGNPACSMLSAGCEAIRGKGVNIETVRSFFLYSTLINYGVLLLWCAAYRTMHRWHYGITKRWFPTVTVEQYDTLNLAGIAA
jgi:hypothetical protein